LNASTSFANADEALDVGTLVRRSFAPTDLRSNSHKSNSSFEKD